MRQKTATNTAAAAKATKKNKVATKPVRVRAKKSWAKIGKFSEVENEILRMLPPGKTDGWDKLCPGRDPRTIQAKYRRMTDQGFRQAECDKARAVYASEEAQAARDEFRSEHDGKSAKQAKRQDFRDAHDGKSKEQVQRQDFKDAHDGKSAEHVRLTDLCTVLVSYASQLEQLHPVTPAPALTSLSSLDMKQATQVWVNARGRRPKPLLSSFNAPGR
jgi:hypothetical protein